MKISRILSVIVALLAMAASSGSPLPQGPARLCPTRAVILSAWKRAIMTCFTWCWTSRLAQKYHFISMADRPLSWAWREN